MSTLVIIFVIVISLLVLKNSNSFEGFPGNLSYFQGPYGYLPNVYGGSGVLKNPSPFGGPCGCHYQSGHIRAYRGKCYNAWGPTRIPRGYC